MGSYNDIGDLENGFLMLVPLVAILHKSKTVEISQDMLKALTMSDDAISLLNSSMM